MRVLIYLAAMLVMALGAQADFIIVGNGHSTQVIGNERWCHGRELEPKSMLVECLYPSKKVCESISKDECKNIKEVKNLFVTIIKETFCFQTKTPIDGLLC
jgi:hypothetical protein